MSTRQEQRPPNELRKNLLWRCSERPAHDGKLIEITSPIIVRADRISPNPSRLVHLFTGCYLQLYEHMARWGIALKNRLFFAASDYVANNFDDVCVSSG